MKKLIRTMACLLSMFMLTSVQAGPFDKGKKRVSLVISSAAAFDQTYTVFGVGIDYMVQDGLQLGIDAQLWSGASPKIYKLSPQVSYIFELEGLRPYGGAFYRKTSIEGRENLASAGYRVGAYLDQGGGYQLAVGYVYEKYLSCEVTVFNDCEDSYPELVLSIAL